MILPTSSVYSSQASGQIKPGGQSKVIATRPKTSQPSTTSDGNNDVNQCVGDPKPTVKVVEWKPQCHAPER